MASQQKILKISRSGNQNRLKFFGVAAALVPLLGVTACGDGAEASSSEEINLVFSTYRPNHHPVVTGAMEPFIEAVAERTDGRVNIELYTDGSLGDNQEQPGLLRSGAADFIEISPAEAPDDFIFGDLLGLYVSETDDPAVEGSQMAWELIHTAPFSDRLDELGFVPIAAFPQPTYEYFSNTPIENVPEDFTGQPARTPGGIGEEVMAKMGMTPVSVSSTELYEALQRGTVGSYVFGWHSLDTYSLAEQTSYATEGLGVIPNPALYMMMSQDSWDGLPEDVQQVIYEEGKKYSLNAGRSVHEDADRARAEHTPDPISVYEVSEENRLAMQEDYITPVLEEFVARMDAAGRGDQAQEAADALQEMQERDIDPNLPLEEWPDYDLN